MTIDEAKAVAKRVTFCGLFSGMTVDVEQLSSAEYLRFWLDARPDPASNGWYSPKTGRRVSQAQVLWEEAHW